MNETLKVIAGRYSCRSFLDTALTGEQVKALADAAVMSPSAKNIQPWRIIVIQNQELLAEMDAEAVRVLAQISPDVHQYVLENGGSIFYGAPAMVLVAVDPESSESAALDCGIVCQNIALAATSMGLGNVICGMARLCFFEQAAGEYAKRLGIPEGFVFGCSVLVGQSAVPPVKPHEPDYMKVSYID